MAVMHITKHAFFVDDHLGWLAAELEQFDLLAIAFENHVFLIRQPDKGQTVLFPVLPIFICIIGTD